MPSGLFRVSPVQDAVLAGIRRENQNCLVSSEPNVLRVEQARHHSERRPVNAQVCSFRKTLRTVQLNYDT